MTTERLKAAKAIMEAEKGLIVDAVDKLGEEATQVWSLDRTSHACQRSKAA